MCVRENNCGQERREERSTRLIGQIAVEAVGISCMGFLGGINAFSTGNLFGGTHDLEVVYAHITWN